MSKTAGMAIALRRERRKVKELLLQIESLENKVDYLSSRLQQAEVIV